MCCSLVCSENVGGSTCGRLLVLVQKGKRIIKCGKIFFYCMFLVYSQGSIPAIVVIVETITGTHISSVPKTMSLKKGKGFTTNGFI